MIKKHLFQRILLLILLYGVIFVLLVTLQFSRQGGFTEEINGLIVNGYSREAEPGDPPLGPGERFLSGEAGVLFGGMEFRVGGVNEREALRITGNGRSGEALQPERMRISGDSVSFLFSRGEELRFTTGGTPELLISFIDETTGEEENAPEEPGNIEFSFRPQGRTTLRNSGGESSFVVIAGGVSYGFVNSAPQGRTLTIGAGETVSYRAIPTEGADFDLGNFIIAQAQTKRDFDARLAIWRDEGFALWSRTAAGQNDEDLIIAYLREALARGGYRAALSAIPAAFLNSPGRTYRSSTYLGRLNTAYQSLGSEEREKLSGLSRLIEEKSPDLLKESHVFEYFAIRGHENSFDQATELVRAIDPKALELDSIPGIFEGFRDWETYRSPGENPFTRLIDEARETVSGSLRMSPEKDKVFVFRGNRADTEFNLRLGKALLDWAEAGNNETWAALARSLILSALSPENDSGLVSAGILLTAEGGMIEDTSSPPLSAAQLYRVLWPGEYYPRALTIGSPVNSIWAWTAAGTLSASQENNILDISVGFPVGETHYMMIRGIRPFRKIQLYDMDYRTDPQFERYDSSGWSYIAAEQCILIKMKHRAELEHIRIFY